MKHKLSEMIKAKAENMDLVIIVKNCQNDEVWWALKSDKEILPSFANGEYFACLPQHKEACLHWLNGGGVAVKDYPDDKIERVLLVSGHSNWHEASVFMCERTGIRIKPKKEKRWIIWNENQDKYHCTFLTDPDGIYEANFKFSVHEIEVEV